jgi:hypothetical protein
MRIRPLGSAAPFFRLTNRLHRRRIKRILLEDLRRLVRDLDRDRFKFDRQQVVVDVMLRMLMLGVLSMARSVLMPAKVMRSRMHVLRHRRLAQRRNSRTFLNRNAIQIHRDREYARERSEEGYRPQLRQSVTCRTNPAIFSAYSPGSNCDRSCPSSSMRYNHVVCATAGPAADFDGVIS